MKNQRYLTKSRFKLATECPTKLFYANKRKEYKDAMEGNDFLAMLAEGGYQVGELAKKRYPEGIDIAEKDSAKALALTQEYLTKDYVVLFEPAISVGNFLIRIDLLVKNGNQFELIEVKAKSYNSLEPEMEGAKGNISSGMLPYLQDVAFQTWVLRQAIPSADVRSFLMMPDKSRKAPVDGINQMFKMTKSGVVESRVPEHVDIKALSELILEKVPVDKYVDQILNSELDYPGGPSYLSVVSNQWAEAYQRDEKITPVIGAHCGGCQFKTQPEDLLKSGFNECWKEAANLTEDDFAKGTVLDLWNFRKKSALIEQGTYKLSQVQREDLGDFEDDAGIEGLSRPQRQWLQVNGIPSDHAHAHDGFYLDDALVSVEMSHWQFPYHLIDFETAAVALPFYSDMHPYESVAFQFSHHVMESDGSIRHAGQFLCVEPGVFPNYAFVRALKAELDKDNGSVFMWSHHENSILSTIMKQLSNEVNKPADAEVLIAFIKTLIKGGERAMIDLCKLAEKAFFHPDTKGSNSIKKVLPAILKSSTKLQERYSKPIYGALNGIPSLNFNQENAFAWLQLSDRGVSDPYAMLKKYAKDLLPDDALTEDKMSIIADGGAATTAYARLQFENLSEETRELIKEAMLRYCELDTLAMVMVLQGWQSLIGIGND
jgi:hypothetical protein